MSDSKLDKYLTTDKKDETSLPDYRPTDYLEPIQIKFAQLKVMTASRTDEEIAERLKIDPKRIRLWKKNKHFIAYSNQLKSKISDQDVFERMKKQHIDLMDLTYTEAMTRYEDPFSEKHQEVLASLSDHSSKEKYLDRFAFFTPHDKLMRTHNEGSKALRLMLPEGMEAVTEIKLKETIHTFRNNYEEGKLKRAEREKALKATGQDTVSPFAYTPSNKRRTDRAELVTEDPVEETVEVREYSITQKMKRKEDE